MRGAVVHGILLAVMLVYGYRTWTRDKTVEVNRGSVVIWDRSEADIASIELKGEKKDVRLEHRHEGGDYWWGLDTAIEKKPKTPDPKAPDKGSADGSGSAAATGSGSGSAGSAGSGSAGSAAVAKTDEEETRKTREFPLGDAADKLIKSWSKAMALRDLGTITDETKKEYKLVDTKLSLVVTFKDGAHTFLVGSSNANDVRYLMDESTKKGYVVAKDMISALELGEQNLHLVDPRGFDVAKIDQVTIEANGKSLNAARVMQAAGEGQQEGKTIKTWGNAATKKPDQTLANFIDNANNLKPTEYVSTLKASDLTPVLKLTYKEERGGLLGTLALYRREKAGELGPDQELDPANPPKGETEYYVITEKSRVPGLVRRDTGSRAEQDLEAVFSPDHPTETPAGGSGSGASPGIAPGTIPGIGPSKPGAPIHKRPAPGGVPAPGAPAPGAPAPGAPAPGAPAPAAPANPHGATPPPAPAPTPPAPAPATP